MKRKIIKERLVKIKYYKKDENKEIEEGRKEEVKTEVIYKKIKEENR